MKKIRPYIYGGLILIVIIMVVARSMRQSKANAQNDAYSNVVSVKGLLTKSEPFTRLIEESGVLTGRKEAAVAAETGGRVLSVQVEVGDLVRAGEPLVRLDDELYQLESERAKIAYDKAQMDLERIEKLYKEKSISDADLENARLGAKGAEVQYRMALRTYNDATIKAPFSGTVAARMTEVGQMVERGMPVVQLVDIGQLKLTVQIVESDLNYVSIGAPATVIVDAAGDTAQGKVTAIGSRALQGARTFPVEIELPGNARLRSGMFARAVISARTQAEGILLPREALLPEVGRTVVYRARGNTADKLAVRIIGNAGERVAVDGLTPGDTVITTGNQMLAQGTTISLVLDAGKTK
jgi:membrane fusion protein (multidrug efflux system)